ncbi:MAG: hypothetical protein IPN22_10985 [Bacteroidetes bacterium]|jgi:hypothetical protein|nr:hypothetical protein [Bacteroidota bacterium]
MLMPGRSYNSAEYRYGFNRQEKTDEISGAGNHTTAKYWEYDSRLGRRWNLDPIFNTDISRYSVNGNNPVYYLDPNGDFKTKFGAKVYNFFHGRKGEVRQSQGGDKKGQWYVGQKVESAAGEKGSGKQADGSVELDEAVTTYQKTYSWRKTGESTQRVGDVVDEVAAKVRDNSSNAWNSPIARYYIPDYYTVSGSFQTSSGVYLNEEGTLTLMLRGKDPGLYFNTTTGFGGVTSVGVDVGCSVGKGYYIGDARRLSSSALGGWQGSLTVATGAKVIIGASVSGGVDVGFGPDGQPTTVTSKVGVSTGIGVSTPLIQGSIGGGHATDAIPIFKF